MLPARMAETRTRDVAATLKQERLLEDPGADLIRIDIEPERIPSR
jgi:4-hydroxy-3-methylbut-2-en-1-yl diphosphate synthase IspG/GcpE